MKLERQKTEPSTRAMLSFDEFELVEALKEAARKAGYIITEREGDEGHIWHSRPDERDYNNAITLCIDRQGTDAAIAKSEVQAEVIG